MKLRKFLLRGGGRIIGARGLKDTQRTGPTESTKQGSSWGLTETAAAIPEPLLFCTRFSEYVLWLFSSVSLKDSYQWKWECLWLLPALGSLFIFLGCLIQPWNEGLCLDLLHLVKLSSADNIGRPGLFWRETKEQRIQGKWRGQTGRNEGRGGWGQGVGVLFGRSKKKFK